MEIRPAADDDDVRKISTSVRAALLTGPSSEENLEFLRAARASGDWLAAWDDDGNCLGHAGGFRFDTTVPGGARVPTHGVSGVGVLPTHTRQGLLTRLLTQCLHDARDRGQPLASLRASEAPIYGRFGFGLGGDEVAAEIDRDGARPLRCAGSGGSMRLLLGDEPTSVVPEVYERAARRRVGTINRHDWHWTRILRSVNQVADEMDAPGTFVAVHRSPDGLDDGYVQYTVKWAEGFSENPRGEGTVHDLWGVDDAVERALWQYLLDIDLIVKWRALSRPTDDPIRRALHDVRAYRAALRVDEQWIRLLDAHAALDARTYGPSAQPVTLGVHDPMFEENCGAWTISADGVERTSRDPDVRVDITALGSAYLGGVSWRDLASSGEVDGADEAVLTALDALFAVRPIPYCGTGF